MDRAPLMSFFRVKTLSMEVAGRDAYKNANLGPSKRRNVLFALVQSKFYIIV